MKQYKEGKIIVLGRNVRNTQHNARKSGASCGFADLIWRPYIKTVLDTKLNK
jgi:hypothetical protein